MNGYPYKPGEVEVRPVAGFPALFDVFVRGEHVASISGRTNPDATQTLAYSMADYPRHAELQRQCEAMDLDALDGIEDPTPRLIEAGRELAAAVRAQAAGGPSVKFLQLDLFEHQLNRTEAFLLEICDDDAPAPAADPAHDIGGEGG